MAYYGIEMRNGDELLHYGVKGMKWGKHIFSKVKGLFDNSIQKDIKNAKALNGWSYIHEFGPIKIGRLYIGHKDLWTNGKYKPNSPVMATKIKDLDPPPISNTSKPKQRYGKGAIVKTENGLTSVTVSNKTPTSKKTSSVAPGFTVKEIKPMSTMESKDPHGKKTGDYSPANHPNWITPTNHPAMYSTIYNTGKKYDLFQIVENNKKQWEKEKKYGSYNDHRN